MWTWSLDWNEITPQIVVGSCPMTVDDIDRIQRGCHVTAVLSVQHANCHAQFGIDYGQITACGEAQGLQMMHWPIRDFDPPDMRRQLPGAVRGLTALLLAGHRVYVHCTAGMGRSPLVVWGYLSFVQSQPPEQALATLRSRRPEIEPSAEAFYGCRQDLVDKYRDQIARRAWTLYEQGVNRDALSDWCQAENEILRAVLQQAE